MTPEACTKARELLGWSRPRLASFAGCSPDAVMDLEMGRRTPRASTHQAIRAALEAQGVEFTTDDASGVRLRRQAE